MVEVDVNYEFVMINVVTNDRESHGGALRIQDPERHYFKRN